MSPRNWVSLVFRAFSRKSSRKAYARISLITNGLVVLVSDNASLLLASVRSLAAMTNMCAEGCLVLVLSGLDGITGAGGGGCGCGCCCCMYNSPLCLSISPSGSISALSRAAAACTVSVCSAATGVVYVRGQFSEVVVAADGDDEEEQEAAAEEAVNTEARGGGGGRWWSWVACSEEGGGKGGGPRCEL